MWDVVPVRCGEAISRIVVASDGTFHHGLCSVFAGERLWRRMVYRRFRAGIETRNVLIVGAGRVGHALRKSYRHAASISASGSKAFVALTEREAESGDADVIGDARGTVSRLARSLFVDEIFFSVPAEKKTGHQHGRGGARGWH